jgi:enoyl-CoA hydratase/carnithine racemase
MEDAPMDNELQRQHDGHVTRLTLNRPQRGNALSQTLVEALLDAVDYAYTDGTRLLIVDGNGDSFCSGFDFAGYQEASEGDLVLRLIRIEHLLQRLNHAPFTTLALAHGANSGAGASLICACHIRVAASGASFCLPGLRFGVVLGTRRLAQRIGRDTARDLLATGRPLTTEEAFNTGFVTRVAARADWPALIAAARAEAGALTALSTARLNEQIAEDTRAVDMAALVQSISVPGLRERIRMFREMKDC